MNFVKIYTVYNSTASFIECGMCKLKTSIEMRTAIIFFTYNWLSLGERQQLCDKRKICKDSDSTYTDISTAKDLL